MSKKGAVLDAWDDDWVNVADKPEASAPPPGPAKISRAERKAIHLETNKQIWQAAEEQERFHFLEATDKLPLKSEFKPQVKVLSRKPQAPQIASRSNDAVNSLAGLSLEDDEDSEEEARRKYEESFKERQRKAALEREEKQRKYAEVRERLFGSPNPASRESSEGRGPSNRPGYNADSRNSSRRARGRGPRDRERDSQPTSSTDQSPARPNGQAKHLFDPTYEFRPNAQISRSSTPREEQPIRMPRGPDASGRGGFGFAPIGGRSAA